MNEPLRTASRIAHACLLGGLLAACTSGRYSLGSSTPPGQHAEIVVLGGRPEVRVINGGPGTLQVRMDGAGDHREETVAPGTVSASGRLAGPVRVWIEAAGAEGVEWRLVAFDAHGLRMETRIERPRP